MKTKSNKRRNKSAHFDLFGEIPVTWPEVYLWCEVITRGKYTLQNRNLMNYVQGYLVVDKIKAVKMHYGTLERYFAATADYLPAAANDSRYQA